LFLQQLLNGLTMGSIYALLAIGVTMIFKAMGMLNVAHGDTIMVATFIALTLYNIGAPLWIAIAGTIVLTAILGLCLEKYIYRKLEFGSFVNLLIATLGVSFTLRNSSIVLWGAEPQLFPPIFSTVPIDINGLLILPQSIGIIVISILAVVLLQVFFYKTKMGKSMRAAATDAEAASMLGINVSQTRFLTFGISAGFAAVAGVLLAPMFYATVDMGVMVGLKAFAAAILGSFGSVRGAMAGGIILGVVEALSSGYISSAYRDVIAFCVLFFILYFKPTGLFVKGVEQKL